MHHSVTPCYTAFRDDLSLWARLLVQAETSDSDVDSDSDSDVDSDSDSDLDSDSVSDDMIRVKSNMVTCVGRKA
jgi:hypothetical protein